MYPARGRSSWRLNESLIDNVDTATKIRINIQTFSENHQTDPSRIDTKWLALKAVLRGLLIQAGSINKRKAHNETDELLSLLNTLDKANKLRPTRTLSQQIEKTREKLHALSLTNMERQLRKLKLTYYMQGNKDIVDELANFYKGLYNLTQDKSLHQPLETEIDTFLSAAKLPRLTAHQSSTLTAKFTEDEVRNTVLKLPKHKAPSPDGFPNRFYHTFEAQLTPYLTDLFNFFRESGSIPDEMLLAHIVTLPKP
ncbi:ORF2, partial [Pelobates cultripes]